VGSKRSDGDEAMTDGPAILELLTWIADRRRTYAETMESWGSNCPRHPAWDDAVSGGLVQVVRSDGGAEVTLTERGRAIVFGRGVATSY
jgi:hypothetical protein